MLVVNLVIFALICAALVWVGHKLDTDWGQRIWNRIYKYGLKYGGQLRLPDDF